MENGKLKWDVTGVILLPFLLIWGNISAQSLVLMDQIQVTEAGKALAFPFAGGLNDPQFSAIDLNADNIEDLFVFERGTHKALTFLNQGTAGQIAYTYAPAYQTDFPFLMDWVLLRDYDCDGKPDIFSSSIGLNGIAIYRNTSTGGTISFQFKERILLDDSTNWAVAVSTGDLPAIVDIDGDGDLDILTFDSGGFHVEWFQGRSMDKYGHCDSLEFVKQTACWGEFMENGLDNTVTINVSCKGTGSGGITGNNSGDPTLAHSGSTLLTFDIEGDGAQELLLGDIGADNIVYLHNGGTPHYAAMDAESYFFPANAPAAVEIFPASFYLDVNNDGKNDLIVAPNAPNISANFNQILYYEDIGTGAAVDFDFRKKTFLQDDMIDCGASSRPVFYDVDGDELLDLIIGNFHYKQQSTGEHGALTYYKNTGTATQPAFELVTRDYLGIKTLFNPAEFGLSPAFGDLDNDGDSDMVLGTFNGKFHYFQNDPIGDSSVFSLLTVNMFGLDVGQNATPQLIDLDRDGILDLIVGEANGNLNFFENKGTRSQMDFSMPPTYDAFGQVDVSKNFTGFSVPHVVRQPNDTWEVFVGSESGHIYQFDQIRNNLGGTFNLLDTAYADLDIGGRAAPFFADIDADGLYEVAVGTKRGGVGLFETSLTTTGIGEEIGQNGDPGFHLFYDERKNELTINLEGKPSQKAAVFLFDMTGRMISTTVIDHFSHNITLPLPGLSPQLLLCHLVLDGEIVGTKKWLYK